MKKFISEFKEFISRGNVIDLAVGIIIGSAFTAIVTSLVNQVIMPAIGFVIGGINFEDFRWTLAEKSGDAPEVAIYFGAFIQQIINFIIISFVVFSMVKLINVLRRKEKAEDKPVAPSAELAMLTEIRDLLKENKLR
ncbi:large-conductance mechanosensitive channel [Ruminiclostridium hungatei]|uniref:Large-conductance mechanosensitive channel n=1 Tax=Ruminiclostridium hungatei TaxID=48256 RepID=A0A1V4SJM2_RUMHU|nr:large-conductance mechanosensitive channel protein MscL [Ruminiclostridium hungatei]OPX44099.1 large-conductance mechanosensitive channel [Ruminiclostridium hungatei]